MQRRCDRNRKRSKRRAIYCPVHGCYMDSMSQKYNLFAEQAGQLQKRGIRRREALILVAAKTAVPLEGEWLEAFWCQHCQETKWYHVHKRESVYELSLAPAELWQQATGVINPHRNPTVSEFTFRQAQVVGGNNTKDFWINN
ncbi:MAG: hypothetical protein F6K62_15245 [Sphaerospermopsis sp. SIO1G2]|nr:hypothetical protein [Sphaerospermopsis sp. SIO1G2]